MLRAGAALPPLLTDLYHFSMAHGYWRCGRHSLPAVFQLYFRSCPLAGEFTLFAGLQDCLAFLAHFQLSPQDVGFLRTVLPPDTERGFYEYLQGVTAEGVTVRAVPEGSVVFPQVPLLEVEGPLAVVQMLETPLLTLVNYASLVATNAARMRLAAGDGRRLLEMGLRRAQGPDGGLSASRYSYIGGFDATSNVLAGKLYDIPLFGSLAHSYITSFTSLSDVTGQTLVPAGGAGAARDLVSLCRRWLSRVCTFLSLPEDQVNMSELAAFISYAASSPNNFVGLVDTYSVVRSGVPNFCAVSLALDELGYRAQGVRVDSGDLLCLSLTVRSTLRHCADRFSVPWFSHIPIIVTNDITEKDLVNLQLLPNAVDSVGVGTNLVTCPLQPSLGCVYKLTQVSGTPRIKLTEDKDKMTLPGKKTAYRLFGQDDSPILDLLTLDDELLPRAGEEICCHVLSRGGERVSVRAARVECLHHVYYKDGQITMNLPTTAEIRSHAQRSLNNLPLKHKHLQEPVPYQVAVSTRLQQVLREVMEEGVPNPGQAPPCPTSLSVAASS